MGEVLINSVIKKILNLKHAKFYLWVGGAYLLLWLFVDLIRYSESFFLSMLNELWQTVYIVSILYLLFEYTLPRLSRKKILKSIGFLAILIFLFSFGSCAWRTLGIKLYIYTSFVEYSSCLDSVGTQCGENFFALLFFLLIRHIYTYIQLKQTTQKLQIEKQEAELNYLKSQTNPHFLFNTLNNIYSLARDKSDLAPESILRLSKILRFMLYETSGAYIAMEQELKIITDYIGLEKLRYDDSLYVNFNHNIEDMKQSIPPLLLIPLVENAFKHGISETRAQPLIDIHLEVKNRFLKFIVKNSAEEFSVGEKVKENIGLSNLRRQLELLYKEYNLLLDQNNSIFTAALTINLASHV